MVNIFEGSGNLGISIEHMISEVTGFRLEKGDSFPNSICPPCLEDAQNAYDIIQTYERSFRIFCEAKDAILEDDSTEEETNHVIPNSESDSVKETLKEKRRRRWKEKKKTHVCSQCKKAFQIASLLKRHIQRTHVGKRPYQCSHCLYGRSPV